MSDGTLANLQWLDVELRKRFEQKIDVMGAQGGLVNELRLFNRVLRRTAQGSSWEPDPGHAEIVLHHFKFDQEGSTSVVAPGLRYGTRRPPVNDEERPYD